jgi:hypothetical protein
LHAAAEEDNRGFQVWTKMIAQSRGRGERRGRRVEGGELIEYAYLVTS